MCCSIIRGLFCILISLVLLGGITIFFYLFSSESGSLYVELCSRFHLICVLFGVGFCSF